MSALCLSGLLNGSRFHSEMSLRFERVHVRTKDVDSDQNSGSSYTKWVDHIS